MTFGPNEVGNATDPADAVRSDTLLALTIPRSARFECWEPPVMRENAPIANAKSATPGKANNLLFTAHSSRIPRRQHTAATALARTAHPSGGRSSYSQTFFLALGETAVRTTGPLNQAARALEHNECEAATRPSRLTAQSRRFGDAIMRKSSAPPGKNFRARNHGLDRSSGERPNEPYAST